MTNYRAYAAELFGTFLLAFMVRTAVGAPIDFPVPIIAGLMLGIIVYMLGSVSGAHVNPAVTLGLWSIGKIGARDAVAYIIAQMVGGFLAFFAGNWYFGSLSGGDTPLLSTGIAEAIGAAILVLGVTSVVYGKTPKEAAGLTIGTALTLGAFSTTLMSQGAVNPAVAVSLGLYSVMYLVGPLVGGIIAAWGYRALVR